MFFSQGLGFMGLFLGFITYVSTIQLTRAIYGRYYLSTHSWPGALGFLLTAAVVYHLSRILNKDHLKWAKVKHRTNKGEPMKHTLFKLPLQYIAAILVGCAAAMLYFRIGSEY